MREITHIGDRYTISIHKWSELITLFQDYNYLLTCNNIKTCLFSTWKCLAPDLPDDVQDGKMIWTEPKVAIVGEPLLDKNALMLVGNGKSYKFNTTTEMKYFKATAMKQTFKDYDKDGMILIQLPYEQITDTICYSE